MVSNGLVNTVGVNLIHRPIIRFTFSCRGLRSSHQRALWIRDPRKLLNFLPQYIYIYIYIIKIREKVYKPNTYDSFNRNISFFIQEKTLLD